MSKWKLIDQDSGAEIEVGAARTTSRNLPVTVMSLMPPHKPGSIGKVWVAYATGESALHYPGMIRAKYVEAPSKASAEIKPDFIAHFGDMSTVWQITAETDKARDFADDNFAVESWQGSPHNFATDWRPARDLCRTLSNQGFVVCCRQPGRPGLGVMKAR